MQIKYYQRCLDCICARFTHDPHFLNIFGRLRARDSDDIEGTEMKDEEQQKIVGNSWIEC